MSAIKDIDMLLKKHPTSLRPIGQVYIPPVAPVAPSTETRQSIYSHHISHEDTSTHYNQTTLSKTEPLNNNFNIVPLIPIVIVIGLLILRNK